MDDYASPPSLQLEWVSLLQGTDNIQCAHATLELQSLNLLLSYSLAHGLPISYHICKIR